MTKPGGGVGYNSVFTEADNWFYVHRAVLLEVMISEQQLSYFNTPSGKTHQRSAQKNQCTTEHMKQMIL